MTYEGPPQPPPESILEKGRKLLAKLRRPHTDRSEQFRRQATVDMMEQLRRPGDKVARDTLETASKQAAENKPPKP